MPYRLATVEPLAIETATDSGDYAATLARCLNEIDWTAKVTMQGKLIEGATAAAPWAVTSKAAHRAARNRAADTRPDGKVAVYVGFSSIGQGLRRFARRSRRMR